MREIFENDEKARVSGAPKWRPRISRAYQVGPCIAQLFLYVVHAFTWKMTKRAYPFEAGVLRQFKTHVNTFECDKTAMKEIQSRTIEKLFLAQKNTVATCQNNNVEGPNSEKDKNLRQKQLSSYFTRKNGNSLKEIKSSVDLNNRINTCTYCDKISESIYKCSICFDQYCQSCSFADYNAGNDEIRICITCS